MYTCPVCKIRELKLYQIDVNVAVYLCEFESCTYPKGHSCMFIERTLEQMLKVNEEEDINLDEFLYGIYENTVADTKTTDTS